jgi:hypothetical protein
MLGIDPFEIKEVEIEGINFTVGHIIDRKMLALGIMLSPVRDKLQGNEILSDKDILLLNDYKYAVVKYGVKGHKNFFLKEREIVFKSEVIEEFGARRSVVSEEILEFYSANGLIDKLATEILNLNRVSGEEAKN